VATSAQVKTVLTTATGVPASVVGQLDRRVRSLHLLPRQQGRFGRAYTAEEIAHLVVGLMIVSDGISRTGTSVVGDLLKIEKVRKPSGLRVKYWAGGVERNRVRLAPLTLLDGRTIQNPSFIDAVVAVLHRLSSSINDARHHVIGLTFAGSHVCGWIEQRVDGGGETELTRHEFGDWELVESAGFKREARFEPPALLQIAELLRPSKEEEA
jgi:hypothetical protein